MRVGVLNDLRGQRVGVIRESNDGTLQGEGIGGELLEQAPLKTFDDWVRTLHHSSYLRLVEAASEEAAG